MASDNEWLWYGRPRDLLGYTEERAKAHKNQFVKSVEELLQKDYPGIKLNEAKDYYRKPVTCDISECFDKESFEFLGSDYLNLTTQFIDILPVFKGNNTTYFLKLDKSEFNPDDLSHYQDVNGGYVKVFPDITLYQYKVRKNFNVQFVKEEDEYYSETKTLEDRAGYIHIAHCGLECVKKAITKVKSPEVSIVNTVKKNMAIYKALIETYKEPYTQWKNEGMKQIKVEEVLRKKLLILAEK